MELAQIRDTLRAIPFRAFTMRLVDGREFSIPHRDFLFVPPNMRHTVCVANTETEAVTILDAILIASITFREEPTGGIPPTGLNGSHEEPEAPHAP